MAETFEVSARSTAPPERVFDLLADNAGWSRWAGPMIRHSKLVRPGTPTRDGVGAIRHLGGRRVGSRELITAFDSPRMIGYTMLSGQPVRDYHAEVRFEPDGAGTRIVWSSSFRPLVPGTGELMRRWLGWIVNGFAQRLAAYAERQ